MNLCTSFFAVFILATTWAFPSEEIGDGEINKAELKDFPGVLWAKGTERMAILRGKAATPERFLRVRYPKDKFGSKDSGASFLVKLPPKKEYRCSYKMRFPSGFDFVKGGKLPGLAGGEATSGGDRPNGGGWSARLMWRSRGDLVLYLYHMDQANRYGDDVSLSVRAPRNRWIKVTQVVTVNDGNSSNGRIRVWIDDALALDRKGLRLRQGNRANVDRFYFSTFFGGSNSDWAPRTNQHVDFADLKVW